MANSSGNDASSVASKDPLLQPLQLKHLTLRNRIMSTSHACGLEDINGYPADRYQTYHEEKAKGGIALTMFGGSSNIAPDSPSVFRQLYVGDDGVIPHLQRFAHGRRGDGGQEVAHMRVAAPAQVGDLDHQGCALGVDAL